MSHNVFSVFNKNRDERIIFGDNSQHSREELTVLASHHSLPLFFANKIEIDEAKVVLERDFYAGKLLNKIEIPFKSMVVILPPTDGNLREHFIVKNDLEYTIINVCITEQLEKMGSERIKIVGVKEPEVKELDITEASIVVCVGRGIGSKEKIDIVKELAKKLGAAFGATRPLVDIEWVDQKHQIGQSGRSIKPDIYIGFGISGAIQHQVGINKSKYIIAVNSDPEAEIFEIADLGIVGDLFEIIPLLIEKLN